MKQKVLIQIFFMINEIDYLERILLLLKQSSIHINKQKFYVILDVTLPISDYLTDWNNSILKQDYFINKFKNLEKYANWCDEYYFNVDNEVKGCTDCCINNIYKYSVDDVIWLDIDIIFSQNTLNLILESSLNIKKIQSKYIITPEYVKLWDRGWDVLVNSNFTCQPYGYQKQHDPIIDTALMSNSGTSLEQLKGYKWGGGWFTLYSKELLDYIQFPRDIKGYSGIDTFIMKCCRYIPNTTQYKIKNLVVAEDYKYIDRTLYKNYLKSINRKQDLFQEGWDKMNLHLQNNILKRCGLNQNV